MIHWKDVDPDRYERAVQALLKRQYPGLRSLDGSGGDGGRDAQLVTEDGTWVFEMKCFPRRLYASQRAQVVKSLKRAVVCAPGMTRWILVIPKSMTSRLQDGRYSDERWFEEELPKVAPHIQLEWWGKDWLDVQAGENCDFQRYIEGSSAQLLQRAEEYGMEAEVMARGSMDLFRRNETLRKRADEISMHWRLSYLVTKDTQVFTLEEKYPGAAKDDPIVLRPTFTFNLSNDEDGTAGRLRSQLEKTLNFGGRVEVPSKHIAAFDVEASSEARLLLAADDTRIPALFIESVAVPLDPPLVGRLSYVEPDGTEAAGVPVYFRERTAGSRGATLWGGDAAGILTIETVFPRPPDGHESGTKLPDASLTIDVGDMDGRPLDAVAELASVLAAATNGRSMSLEIGHGHSLLGTAVDEPQFPGAERLKEVADALVRLQRHASRRLWFPREMTVGEADMLIVAARLLDGEQVSIPGDEWTVGIEPFGVDSVLKLLSRERFQLLVTRPDTVLIAGDLQISYGPMVQWGPELSLINRRELERHDGISSVRARLATNGRPVCWLPFEKAKEVAEAKVPTA